MRISSIELNHHQTCWSVHVWFSMTTATQFTDTNHLYESGLHRFAITALIWALVAVWWIARKAERGAKKERAAKGWVT